MIRATGPLIPSDTNNSSSRSTFIKTGIIQASSITTSSLHTTNFTTTSITSDGLIVNNDPNVIFVETGRITNPAFPSTTISQSYFIISTAISGDGNTAAIGVATSDNEITGGVYVYVKTNGMWTQQGSKLVGTGSVDNSRQGTSISLSYDGSTLASGGPDDDGYIGAVWIFTRTGSSWTQQGSKLVGSGAIDISGQGCAVSLSANGSTLAVGGSHDDNDIGAVWIFTRTGSSWTQQGLKLVGTDYIDEPVQGTSVSLSSDGNTLAIGGTGDDNDTGAVWVFTRTTGTWTQQGPKLLPNNYTIYAGLGISVSLNSDGNTLAIGGYSDGDTGATWVFTRTGDTWIQGPKLVGTGYVGFSNQGQSISLNGDGDILAVAGPYDNDRVGAVWIFTKTNDVWTQQGPKIVPSVYSALYNLYFGNNISINSDGTSMISVTKSEVDSFGNIYNLKTTFPTTIESTDTYISNLDADIVNVNSTLSVPNLNVTNLVYFRNNLYGSRPSVFAQSIPNNTPTLLTTYWNVNGFNNNPSISYEGFPVGAYTINRNCYILVTVSASFASNATGTRTCYISKNNTTPYYGYATVPAITDDITSINCSSIIQCASGDTISIYVKQTSGSALVMDTTIENAFNVIFLSNPF